MGNFKYISKRLSEKLELPEDAVSDSFRLQLIGEGLIVCGCKKLLKYKSEEIVLLTGDSVITLLGKGMKCIYFFEKTIEIRGDFTDIRLENR